MSSFTRSMWRRANVTRLLAIGATVAFGAFFSLMFLASLGDSDLPPYHPPFPGERVCWIIWAVVSWPFSLTALVIGHDPPGVFLAPLLLLAGLFWALLIEACIVTKHARKA